ncbi:MAG: SGNH/GDSL hydrolase family protein [Chloroflexi bacterium]|nr:SGNH/GDSL hydrolase family protein [Chloroflexota bacterium]
MGWALWSVLGESAQSEFDAAHYGAGAAILSVVLLGRGYAMLAAAWFSFLYPEKRVRFLNRGISGNRTVDLRERWQRDCLDLRPTWLSIYVGINDTWRRFDRHMPTTTEEFGEHYRALLQSVSKQLPDTRPVIVEPFVLPVPPDRREWRQDLDPKIAVVRSLALEYRALYVPLDGLFAQAATRREPEFWAPDGVHPTPAGHALIAQAWLNAVKAL